EWDAAILDFNLPGFGAMEALEIAQDHAPDMPCILVSGVIDAGTAVEAMRAGVRDYLMKDDLARLAPAIARELEGAEAGRERRRAERASLESEDRFRSLVESSVDGVLAYDAELLVSLWSLRMERMTGLAEDEVLGKNVFVVLPSLKGASSTESAAAPKRYPFDRTSGSGWFESSRVTVRDADGNLNGGLVIIRDVTEQVQSEHALRESESRYRTVVEASQDGVIVTDGERRVTMANPAAVEMFGYSSDEMRGLDVTKLFAPGDESPFEAAVASNFGPRRYVGRRVRKDGSTFFVEVSAVDLFTDGELSGTLADIRDVTERVESEDALRASEQRFRSLLDAIPDLIFVVKSDGTIVDFHAGDATLYLPPEEFIGRRIADVMPADVSGPSMTAIEAALRTRDVQVFKYRLPIDGVLRDFEARDIPIGPDEVVVIARDITEQVRLEEQLLVAQKSEALGTLVAGVAHDFNNLLTGLSGSIELARREPENPKWLDGAETATRRAGELIRELLQFSRRAPPARVAVDLREIARETISLARPAFDPRVALEIDASEPIPPVDADPGQLEQVLMNLLVNALNAVEERAQSEHDPSYRPQVRVTVHVTAAGTEAEGEPGQAVVMSVIDNGVGISAEVRKRIFDPFFTTKAVGAGTGLGLSTAYGIIAEHGGSIDVTSTPGAGSTFAVVLPVGGGDLVDSASSGDGVAALPSPGGGGAVLVVDDEPVILASAERVLTDAGYQVVIAADGAAALRAVQAQTFHVAVVDVSMPSPDGWDVLAQIRDLTPDTKVLMTSGYGVEDEVVARGGYGFITKPYTLDQLVAAVNTAQRDLEHGGRGA
ncbi:MAG: PAS domain S-box protein, partial [Dehalococcoidia bacterium]